MTDAPPLPAPIAGELERLMKRLAAEGATIEGITLTDDCTASTEEIAGEINRMMDYEPTAPDVAEVVEQGDRDAVGRWYDRTSADLGQKELSELKAAFARHRATALRQKDAEIERLREYIVGDLINERDAAEQFNGEADAQRLAAAARATTAETALAAAEGALREIKERADAEWRNRISDAETPNVEYRRDV